MKKITKKSSLLKGRWAWAILALVILLGFWGGLKYYQAQQSRETEQRKQAARLEMENLISLAKQLPGEVVYVEEPHDIGCYTWDVNFGSTTRCSYSGGIILRDNSDSSQSKSAIEDIFYKAGYVKSENTGEITTSLNDWRNVNVNIQVYDKEAAAKNTTQQEVFKVKNNIPLEDGQYLYGFTMDIAYRQKGV